MELNQIAKELNQKLFEANPTIRKALSKYGEYLFFPKGIISQSAEAAQKAHRFNATIGIAADQKQPMRLASLSKYFEKFSADSFNYAPTRGLPKLRQQWKEKIYSENPSLGNTDISLPIVTNALTHGIFLTSDIFADKEDVVVVPEHFWGNYNLMMSVRKEIVIQKFPTFSNNGFNVQGFLDSVERAGKEKGKALAVLNFPNNPTGYTITPNELTEIKSGLKKIAEKGITLIIICDDAYFGLFFENTIKESIFASLAGLHPNLLAVKCDGATKELYAWGFRVGFLTFGIGGENQEAVYNVFEEKFGGAVRGTISSASRPGQEAISMMLAENTWKKDQEKNIEIIGKRYRSMMKAINNPKYKELWEPYPCNSGYFLTIKLLTVDAEPLRQHLLDQKGIGVIQTAKRDIRITFSSLDEQDCPIVVDELAKAIQELS